MSTLREEQVAVLLPLGHDVLADFLESYGQSDAAAAVRGQRPLMKLWLLTQSENTGYDTYDSCVVAAENEEAAKAVHPSSLAHYFDPTRRSERNEGEVGCWVYIDRDGNHYEISGSDWVRPDQITVEFLGVAIDRDSGVVCASFNAG